MSTVLDQHRQSFESDPSNKQAFDALEEHYFMAGQWDELVAVYDRRLAAPEFSSEPTLSVSILFRLAQVYEERCLDTDLAIENYWKAAKIDPTHRAALRQLRQIYAQRDQWDMVLQIAEMEGQLEMELHEKAGFLAELGNLWNERLGDPSEAMTHFQDSLALVPDHMAALTGLAQVHEALGHHQQAAAAWERLSNRLRGPDRAPVLVSLGEILAAHLDQPERAVECFRGALDDDPRCAGAIAALTATATSLENWPLVAELYERRFDIASGARKRAAIAVEAGRLNLERLDDTQAARMWFDRALELVDEEVSIFYGLAELERRTGNHTALSAALDRVVELRGDEVPIGVLLESADLHSEAGNDDTAIKLLRQAQVRAPEDALVAETLSDCLARMGLSEELVGVLERRATLTEDDPRAQSEFYSEIGRIQLEDLGTPDQAMTSFVRAFELDPSTHDVVSKLEPLYREREQWGNLRALLERACRDGSTVKRSHYFASLGELRENQLGDSEGAVSAFESALELDPECLVAHEGVARIAQASGNPDDLLRVFEREAKVTSDRTRLAELVWKMVPLLEERGRNEAALGWAERLRELIPNDRQALETIVRLRESLGRRDQLQDPLEGLDRVLTGKEQTANRRRLAEFHLDAGRHPEAIEWYQSSLEGDPNHVESLRSLKDLYNQTRDFEALARTMRRLADALPEDVRHSELTELASLLVDQLGDVEGGIVILWRLAKLPADQRPDGIAERLENLLERAGRFEELAQQLLERRRSCDDESSEARALDLRRAKLLLDDLGQYEEAVTLFGTLRARGGEDDQGVLEGLEKALRLGNDAEGLADLLAERAARESSPVTRAHLQMERATLLEDSLGAFDEAREALAELADQTRAPEIAEQAGRRLEQILIRCGDWEALLDRLNARLGTGSKQDDLALHEEIARLCRDRFGQREACAEHLEAAGKIAPERHALWHNLAVIYAELDRPKDLLRVLENELKLDLDRERETMLRSRAARLAGKLPDGKERCSKHYERLLELEPGDPEATEFLLDFYERENRPVEMAQLLRARLDATLAQNDRSEASNAGVISLRLRLAALQSEALDDSDAAIATLAPAIDEVGPVATVARPLADLYLRLDRRDEFIALSQRAADHCDLPEERANWLLQVGDALQRDNEAPRAIEAYRGVLEASPQNLDAQAALRELYRASGDVAPLAELLKLEVGLRSGASANPVRLELATLLAGPLAQPEQALDAFRQILEEDARHPQAFVHAIDLTRRLDRHAETLELLDRGLANIGSANPIARAALLEQLGDLEAGPLDTPASALGRYREALALDPTRSRLRASICETLGKLGRWNELLDSLFLEAQRAQSSERCEIFERAIEIASREISQDAGLPWLERLHAERPDDPEVLSRIADIHRQAGRPEALLRALEAQMPLRATAKEQHTLHRSMARILERDLSSPGRAAQTLEAARAIDADDPEVLAGLDRLYEAMGRHAERVQIIEDRIACSATSESSLRSLHRDAANLWQRELSSPDAATRHLLHGIEQCEPGSTDFLSLIRQLQETLRASGRLDGWARAAERELAQLTALRDPADDERRYQLHSELADCCEHQLARPQLALNHLLALLDDWDGAEPLATGQTDLAEAALVHHLRRERNHVELERRLAARLDRIDGNSDEWLELAVLQAERLHRPSAARRAFRHVLEQKPECLEAIHGLRATAEIQQDWEGVAESLDRELELEHGGPASTEETCALLLRLGEIARRRLQTEDALERASAAYGGILTRKPEDVDSLHALQQIAEERGEYGEAISRYEQEVELLRENDSDRRQSIWLRVGEIARDKTDELDRAVRAFVSAAQCSDLPAERLREWADLYRATGDSERFAEVFGQWCDAPGSPAGCAELLVLVDALQDLGRDDQALERAEMAIEADRTRATAWERAAELREKRGDSSAAADHLAEAAELADSATAAVHLLHASRLVCEQSPTRSVDFLRRGADHDAGSQEIQARLAIGCERLELWGEAEEAAGHALDMNADRDALEPGLLLKAALAGGRAAWREESLESATRLFSTARDLDPDEREALDSLGELLYLCGDVQQARGVLETRLAMSGENTKTGRQLAIVGEAFALEEEFAKALASFERAAEAEPNLDQAHEGIVSIHERNEKPLAAISALDDWIAVQEDATRKSAQLLRAAAIEQSIEETDSAIERLDEATTADPTNAGAWIMLADLLFRLDQPDGALEVATSGLAAVDDTDRASVASLSFIRGSVLEQAGDTEDAIAAYARTVENDNAHSDAALAQANLLRNNGEWQMAADALGDYLENHPEPTSPMLARVHYKRGRLLAGPLEQVEEAIQCYELAIRLDPDFSKAIEPLANLLTHMPDRWPEAIRQHCALLAIDSARESSIRSLVKICETRGDDQSQRGGLAILRALGTASQEEFEAASDQLDFKVAEHLQLPDPHWERLRKMIRQSSHEIAQALSAETARARAAEPSQGETGTGTLQPAQQAFWDSLYAAEAELSVPGFEVLPTAIIAQTIQQVAALALDASPPEIDSDIYHDIGDQLERSIGRWTRRKHRKNLEGTDSNDVGRIPWDEWRMALRGIAACAALDRDHGDLRRALITLSTDPEDVGCEEMSDTTNIADRVRSSEPARALLDQVTRVWCSRIDN